MPTVGSTDKVRTVGVSTAPEKVICPVARAGAAGSVATAVRPTAMPSHAPRTLRPECAPADPELHQRQIVEQVGLMGHDVCGDEPQLARAVVVLRYLVGQGLLWIATGIVRALWNDIAEGLCARRVLVAPLLVEFRLLDAKLAQLYPFHSHLKTFDHGFLSCQSRELRRRQAARLFRAAANAAGPSACPSATEATGRSPIASRTAWAADSPQRTTPPSIVAPASMPRRSAVIEPCTIAVRNKRTARPTMSPCTSPAIIMIGAVTLPRT